MADNLYEMTVFARVVSAGSLSAAARELGLSTAVVSRRLAALETRLGVRLLNRTTRSLSLTDEGANYHEPCMRILPTGTRASRRPGSTAVRWASAAPCA
ncbi:MAG: LysR family transcriptional regulator [Betaproteobacteria bacterium]|nr:LysR family transcriptional regulator [Betaproteobacteria bacterium]